MPAVVALSLSSAHREVHVELRQRIIGLLASLKVDAFCLDKFTVDAFMILHAWFPRKMAWMRLPSPPTSRLLSCYEARPQRPARSLQHEEAGNICS